MTFPSHRALHRQSGIAAIEFALVFGVFFIIFYAIVTFGAVLYTQQAVSRAVNDGARSVLFLGNDPFLPAVSAANQAQVQSIVWDSLAGSLIAPPNTTNRRQWVQQNVTVQVTPSATRAEVSVVYPYSSNRILPSIPIFDISTWMPNNIVARASVNL